MFPIILVALIISIDGCKKSETATPITPTPTSPVFSIDHTFISVGGKNYIQFVSCCTSEAIKLTNATITDPGKQRFSYDYYSDTTDYLVFCKNESFTFPEDFSDLTGIWTFTFTGQRYSDNSAFTSQVNDTIPN
jgi:hypothetical protein